METSYKRTVAGSVGAGIASVFNASGRQYYILEHKTESLYHHAGESQKIIVDQIELGRDSACQVRFDEAFETVSRRHAAIVKEGDGWKIIPLSQTNPTFVNGIPIQGDTLLKTGDEIRLSSKGPLMGFIIPQGKQSLVSSIGMTERLNLFRKQALRPYKRALWIMFIVLVLAVAGLVTWNVLQGKKFEKELLNKQEQIIKVQNDLKESDAQITDLTNQLKDAANKSDAEKRSINEQLQKAQRERDEQLLIAIGLSAEVESAMQNVDDANAAVKETQEQLDALIRQIEDGQKKAEQEKVEREKEESIADIVGRERREDPDIK